MEDGVGIVSLAWPVEGVCIELLKLLPTDDLLIVNELLTVTTDYVFVLLSSWLGIEIPLDWLDMPSRNFAADAKAPLIGLGSVVFRILITGARSSISLYAVVVLSERLLWPITLENLEDCGLALPLALNRK